MEPDECEITSLIRGQMLLATRWTLTNLEDATVSDTAEDAPVVLQEGFLLLPSPLVGSFLLS